MPLGGENYRWESLFWNIMRIGTWKTEFNVSDCRRFDKNKSYRMPLIQKKKSCVKITFL